jgi:hypothetical protein
MDFLGMGAQGLVETGNDRLDHLDQFLLAELLELKDNLLVGEVKLPQSCPVQVDFPLKQLILQLLAVSRRWFRLLCPCGSGRLQDLELPLPLGKFLLEFVDLLLEPFNLSIAVGLYLLGDKSSGILRHLFERIHAVAIDGVGDEPDLIGQYILLVILCLLAGDGSCLRLRQITVGKLYLDDVFALSDFHESRFSCSNASKVNGSPFSSTSWLIGISKFSQWNFFFFEARQTPRK